MLLEDFDSQLQAVINPENLFTPNPDMPEIAVGCFSHVTFVRMLEMLRDVQEIAQTGNANGKFPVYRGNWQGIPMTLFVAQVGAPNCVATLEELTVMGARKFIIFGNCGVLDGNIRDCGIIIPTSAMRDEGTSYHYAPPSDEIAANPKYRDVFERILHATGVDYTVGKVWTTDAFYRETRAKVEKRRQQGCICVDMECSALMALAQMRDIEIFEFFYAGDNLDREQWDPRSLSTHAMVEEKDRASYLALELARHIMTDCNEQKR